MAPHKGHSDPAAMLAESGPLGILAGAGAYPIEIAEAVSQRGRGVHIVAIDGFADAATARFPHERVGLGQVGRMLASLRRAGCRDMVIAGGLRRPDLTKLRPDWGLVRFLPTIIGLTRGGDDSVLRRVVRFFEGQGFIVRGAADVAPELLATTGPLGLRVPDADDEVAIRSAARAIQALGPFDIGQAAVATRDGVVALETTRGTDALLAALASDGAAAGQAHGGVLVKLAKPGQELRVDLPAIGPRTVEGAVAAGLKGIAVGAGHAIVLQRSAMSEAADRAGLFVQGIDPSNVQAGLPIDPAEVPQTALRVVSRRAPTPAERRDVAIGRRLMGVVAREDLGRAAIVAGEHVLAVSGMLDPVAMIRATGRDSQWGRRLFKSQIGTLLIDVGARQGAASADVAGLLSLETFTAARDGGLAGIACLGGGLPAERREEIVGWAKDARIFLLVEEAADGAER